MIHKIKEFVKSYLQDTADRPSQLDDDWSLCPDSCSTRGSQLWRREWPDKVYCEKCNKETNITSALSYL